MYHGRAGLLALGKESYLGLTLHAESGDMCQVERHPWGKGETQLSCRPKFSEEQRFKSWLNSSVI